MRTYTNEREVNDTKQRFLARERIRNCDVEALFWLILRRMGRWELWVVWTVIERCAKTLCRIDAGPIGVARFNGDDNRDFRRSC